MLSRAVNGVNAIAPGRLLTYSEFTVAATIPTAPEASNRPRRTPATEPPRPMIAASVRNAASTPPRVAPNARRTPISARRRTTETEIVL